MNDSIKRMSLDIHRLSAGDTVSVKKGYTGKTLYISLVDCGVPYMIKEDCNAVFTGKKPDGRVIYNDCIIQDNTIIYKFTEQTVSTIGKVDCEIQLFNSDKRLIICPKFTIIVTNPVYNDGDEIESENELNAKSKKTVLYADQKLKTEEKAQARKNIDAMQNGVADTNLNMQRHGIDNASHITLSKKLEVEGVDVYTAFEVSCGSKGDGTAFVVLFDVNGNPVRITGVADGATDSDAATCGQLWDAIGKTEQKANRVTTIDKNATDEQYPTAKAVYDFGQNGGSASVTDEKYFDIDFDGVVSLKKEYRGTGRAGFGYSISDNGQGVNGSKNEELPEKIIIPDVINGTAVSGFQQAAFGCNLRIKEITIPSSVKVLPDRLFTHSLNLVAVNNTENIEKLGSMVFANTRTAKAIFPNLKEVSAQSFAAAAYLYYVDIGNNLSAITSGMLQQCLSLSLVRGGANVKTIDSNAFYNTPNLKNLELLTPKITSIGNQAFLQSRIQYDWSKLDNCTFGTQAYPTQDNTSDYWTGVTYTPCKNELVTILSQTNAAWVNQTIPYVSWTLGGLPTTYNGSCHTFCVMHIYSALTGTKFTHPDEFMKLLNDLCVSGTQSGIDWRLNANVPGDDHSAKAGLLFSDLGFKVTEYRNTGNSITKEEYQAMCDALARGAYVYTQTATPKTSTSQGSPSHGHVVVAYGINEIGEILFLRPDNLAENYRTVCDIDALQLYRMPYQNMSGPTTNFVIVEKK